MRWKSLHAQTTSRTSWVYSLLSSLCAFMPFLYHTKQKTMTHTFHHYVFSLVTSLHSRWRFQTWEVAFSDSFHKLEALLAAGSVGARKWGPEQDPAKCEESGGKWGNKRERKGENRREKVWEIWVKRTVCRRVRVGAGVDHPHHMFYSVLQRGWLWAKHSQHTRPHALPDGLIFTALPPLKP